MSTISQLRELFTISNDGRQCVFHAQMERNTYVAVADILERLEGKWSRSEQAFTFSYDAAQIIEQVFTSGITPKRNPNQFHPTPRTQVLDMINSSERLQLNLMFGATDSDPEIPADKRNIRMLEPSIGRLGIANVVKELYPHVHITGCEIDAVNAKIAREAGFNIIEGDFLEMPIPESEEEKFDCIVMNPPFLNRGFIKHIRHAQKCLKKKGTLVSVVPSEWMKSATSPVEVAFMDEVTRTSSEVSVEYDKDTYESTDTTTRIVELMHPDEYLSLVQNNKEYWIHVNLVEMENDYKFRTEFEQARGNYKRYVVERELKRRRNIEKSPSVVEWVDDVLAALMEEQDEVAKVDNTPKLKEEKPEDTAVKTKPAKEKTTKALVKTKVAKPVTQEAKPVVQEKASPAAVVNAANAASQIMNNKFAVLF